MQLNDFVTNSVLFLQYKLLICGFVRYFVLSSFNYFSRETKNTSKKLEANKFLIDKMASNILKVESGVQLLARLTKKSGFKNFFPLLFGQGLEAGHVIELYGDHSTKHILQDIITETLIPSNTSEAESGVLLFNINGHITFECLLDSLKRKLQKKTQYMDQNLLDYNNKLEKLLHDALKNLYMLHIDEINQFYVTIQNLENVLSKNCNISLVAFDSPTAFYWSEQDFKITKMDIYLKKILLMIQKVCKDYKVIIIYTRPEYFSSTKEPIEKLEKCSKHPANEQINYRIQVVFNTSEKHYLNIQSYDKIFRREFDLINDELILH